MNTNAAEKRARRARILKFLNALALKPVRTCRTLHHCEMCGHDITDGQQYRDGGVDKRAHEDCFQVWRKEIQ